MDEQDMHRQQSYTLNPFPYVLHFLALYGWMTLGAAVTLLALVHYLRPRLRRWQEAREDAAYHKDPDRALARLEAVQRARERQQQLLLEASQRALEQQKEREERKKQENAELLKKYGSTGGRRLNEPDDGFLPLSAGPSTSSYRPPKRSACGGGGCGR